MMRPLLFAFFFISIAACHAQLVTPQPLPKPRAQLCLDFKQAMSQETDPAKRAQMRDDFAHLLEETPNADDAYDLLTRDGAEPRVLTPPSVAGVVKLKIVSTLPVELDEQRMPSGPVFRRLSQHRIEVWTIKEGWLLDQNGKILVHAIVPRRDGAGREWFGAFLPNGMWITTDLWENDTQLNCFNSKGVWMWELKSQVMEKRIPDWRLPHDIKMEVPHGIAWARADNTGGKWLVFVGLDLGLGECLVSPNGTFSPLPIEANIWQHVYPRSMPARGYYTSLNMVSDDGELNLWRFEPAHGMGVGFPNFQISGETNSGVDVYDGDWNFGFWPGSHHIFIEQQKSYDGPVTTYFYDDRLHYEAQVEGTELGDSARGGMLIRAKDDSLLRLSLKEKPQVESKTLYVFPDGTSAKPLWMADDLGLGIFSSGSESGKLLTCTWTNANR